MRKFKRKAKNLLKSKEKKESRINLLLNNAKRYQQTFNLDQAKQEYNKALQLDPNNQKVLSEFGLFLFLDLKDYNNAQKLFEKAAKLYPQDLTCFENLAKLYYQTNKWDLLEKVSEKHSNQPSNKHIPYYYRAQALRVQKEYSSAIELLDKAIDLSPLFDFAHVELCSIYEELGNKDKLKSQLDQLKGVLEKIDNKQKNIDINYILGRYYDILNEYDTAFLYFKSANDLRKSECQYDLTKDKNYVRRIKNIFGGNYLKRLRDSGYIDKNITPIFIIGMPRSGTSLVEQVLSSHPQVSAAGELSDFYDLSTKYTFTDPRHHLLHGKDYINILSNIKKNNTTYVTDKMPDNFLYAGLIKLSLPNAKIIHCVRNPMDTCFSCYKQGFVKDKWYTCDLDILGRYYKIYQELMEHWHMIMPDFIWDVHYENIVNNFEGEMRDLLSFCNLQWHDSCSQYFKTSRRVNTASRDQVIKPIYNSSIDRWKKYKQYLQPLSICFSVKSSRGKTS